MMRSVISILTLLLLLSGCSGLSGSTTALTDGPGFLNSFRAISSIDSSTIHRAKVSETTPGHGVILGQIRFVTDGKTFEYNFLNHPTLTLVRDDLQQYFATPEADKRGSFAWSLPAGIYEVAVIGGGPPGIRNYWWRKDGQSHFVNGLTDPHIFIAVEEGATYYIGTIEVDISTRETDAIIKITNERIFEALNGIRIVDDYERDFDLSGYQKFGAILKRLATIDQR